MLKEGLPYKEIHEKVGISLKLIVDINRGSYANSPKENYPIRSVWIGEDIKDAIRETLLTTNKKRQEIADEFGVSLSTVKRIKA